MDSFDHLSADTHEWLCQQEEEGNYVTGLLASYDEGWIFTEALEDFEDYPKDYPADLMQVLRFADEAGISYIHIHEYGEETALLPTYKR